MNPQSLNRYAYALNNPTTNVDPLGLACSQGGQIGTDSNGLATFAMNCNANVAGNAPAPGDNPLWDLATQGGGNTCDNSTGFCGSSLIVNFKLPPGCRVIGNPIREICSSPAKPAPPPPAPLTQRIANVAQCASSLANTLSVATLAGWSKNSVANVLFSNVFSSATDLIFGTTPNQYVPGGASVVASTKGMNLVSRGMAAGAAGASSTEVDPGFQFIFSNVPATTLGETALGGFAVGAAQVGAKISRIRNHGLRCRHFHGCGGSLCRIGTASPMSGPCVKEGVPLEPGNAMRQMDVTGRCSKKSLFESV